MRFASLPFLGVPMGFAVITLWTGSLFAHEGSFEERLQNYERFMRVRNLVKGTTLSPQWLEDGVSFTFTDQDRRTFLVDPLADTITALSETSRSSSSSEGGLHVRVRSRGADLEIDRGEGFERLTDDGAEGFEYLPQSVKVSPDARHLAVVQLDRREVYELTVVDYTLAIPKVRKQRYPKSGDACPRPSVYLYDLEQGSRVSLEIGEDPESHVALKDWNGERRELILIQMTRDAKTMSVLAFDEEGQARELLHEKTDTFIAGLGPIIDGFERFYYPLGDGDHFIWRSERNGFAHFYLYDYEGELVCPLTQGAFVVDRIEAIDLAEGLVYFSASTEERPYDRQIYSVEIDGTGMQRITEEPGIHHVKFSPSKEVFIDTHSTVHRPPRMDLRTAEGDLLRTLQNADIQDLEATGWIPPEPFVVKAADGETDLYGVLYKPIGFDPSRSYPVIDYIYAGPWLQVVQHEFMSGPSMGNWAQALAQMGYVVFMVDGRGTPGRSKAFQDVIYGCIGEHEIADHVATLQQLAETRPYMDLQRVGIRGASWGGYFALRAMFTAPDVFKAGVSIAPGDLTEGAAINEPYMDLPSRNQEGYRLGSVLHRAHDLQGELLIVHGTSDVNAPFSTTMRVVQALIDAGKHHDLVVLPNQGHGFSGSSQRYFQSAMLRFFEEHLRP